MKNSTLRRIIAIVLALCLCVGLAACGGGGGTSNGGSQTPTNNSGSSNTNNAGGSSDGNENSNSNEPEYPRLAKEDDETAKKCLELVKEKYGYTETMLDQDPEAAYLYDWEVFESAENTYYVAYTFDYDNNTKDDGYAVVGYECVVNGDSIEIHTPNTAGQYTKYENLGFSQHQAFWTIEVNRGYYEDELGLIENPQEAIWGLAFFFRNLGIQPYIYTSEEKLEGNLIDAAEKKYNELFAIDDNTTDGYHVLIYLHKGNDGNYSIAVAPGKDANRLLGNDAGDLIRDAFIDEYNATDDFSEVVSNTCIESVASLYTCAYDSYYMGKETEIPTDFTFIDEIGQTSEEYYPRISLADDETFEYLINAYEGMHVAEGTYFVIKDSNANTVIECTISEEPDANGATSVYDGVIFDLVSLGDSGIWMYIGDDTGMTWDRCLFNQDEDADSITVTLK